jgi:hypothetical protein
MLHGRRPSVYRRAAEWLDRPLTERIEMIRHAFRTLAFALVLVAFPTGALAAAGPTTTTVLTAQLSGRFLHTTSTGSGSVKVRISPSGVCWKFSYRGLDTPNISGVHISPPPAAGVHKTSVFPFTATTSTTPGCDTLTRWGHSGPGWAEKIAADPSRFYVIIGTSRYPQGAIGGPLSAG